MRRIRWKSFLVCLFLLNIPDLAFAKDSACISCHTNVTPNIVSDFRLSKHAPNGLDCSTCHGSEHTGPQDVANVKIPTPATCQTCHPTQVEQFSKGKHALAWTAMYAMPTIHQQPMALIEGQKGCGGCHKLGLKSEQEIAQLKQDGQIFGVASCDACHTRHTFSKAEAQEPEACETCHMGFDHPQWEMYTGSKHGVRYMLRREGVLPETAAAPKCQTCHMQQGNHEVRTAWGFLAVKLPIDDPQWAADQALILQGLGVLDPQGNPTARLDAVKAADMARLDAESFQKERERMVQVCTQCHSEKFAGGELAKGDQMVRETDRLMAEAIQIVSGLYNDGILKAPAGSTASYPDILSFYNAPSPIEQTLFHMYNEHRMRAFQGTFHASQDYALWYGWGEMNTDLVNIRWMADEMRNRATLVTPTTVLPTAAGPLGSLLGSLQNLKR